MGIATHLGPWLLGTVKDTTGTTAGLIRNTGATIVAQTNSASFGFAAVNASLTGTVAVLPAGALITSMQFITTSDYSAAVTVKLSIGATDIVAAATVTTSGVTVLSSVASAAVAALINNVGATDAIVTFTATKAGTLTTGTGTVLIGYMVRNSDGTSVPASA